jgi:hypothetical protein
MEFKGTKGKWKEDLEIDLLIEKYESKEISKREFITMKHNIFYQAKEMEKQQKDDFAIEFSEWCLNSLLNGEEPKAETMKELLEIFKNK